MIILNGVTYLTVEECLQRLAALQLVIAERTFRQLVRRSGAYLEHRRQLILTEADLAAVIETLRKQRQWPSSSSGGPAPRSGISRVPSAESVTSRALAQAAARTRKRSA